MRLDRLDLTRYGRFTDRSLAFARPADGAPDLHVIYGANEAGKSTLFSAWLDLLFGVPTRTKYDFLHPGPTMQIGAQLTHEDTVLDLKRMKRNSASLLDRHDTPLPEIVLQGALGGLSRDGYSSMFSLDDDTLEKGGDSILASRGDLGEMLFSASAGLSGLAPQLKDIRTGLDAFHRSGGRSGWLHDAKKQLADLDKERRQREVSASALQKLGREATATEQDWREARAREDAAQTELDRLQDLAGTLPLLAQLTALEARLESMRGLPDATVATLERCEKIDRDRLELATRIRDRATRLQGLRDQRAAIATDPDALGQEEAIQAAEAMWSGYDTAIKDLPRRWQEAGDADSSMNVLLAQLGRHGAEVAEVCLPASRISALRVLLTARSGVQSAAETTAAETRKAADLLERERERLGDPGPDEDEAALSALLARLRAQDPVDALSRAMRDRDQAGTRVETALGSLAPWKGDCDALAALVVPPDWQITEWEQSFEAARQQGVDADRDAVALRADLARLQADTAARSAAQSATGVTLVDAATARSRREALWATHLTTLSAASAQRFEQALREDDRISAVVAEAMAEARREVLDQAAQDILVARLEAAEARRDRSLKAQQQTLAALEAANMALGLRGGTVADLRDWIVLRTKALAERTVWRDAQTTVDRCETALMAARQTLGIALGRPATESFEILLATCVARINASERRREARERLLKLTADLRERRQAQVAASSALEHWRQGWNDASRDSVMAAYSADAPDLGNVLNLLDQLGREHDAAAALRDRIDKMQANRDRFLSAKAAVLRKLDQDENSAWADVLTRLRRAKEAARDHEKLDRDIAEEARKDAEDSRALKDQNTYADELGAALGWSADDGGSLVDHVRRCLDATTLRREIKTRREDLRDRPSPVSGEDIETVKQGISRLKADLPVLRNETETRLAAYLEAKRRVDEVGGDDGLARIAATRENLLLDIRERAEAHLTTRFGLIAFERGLRRYRDQHRSAMLTRASEAFNRLSRGAYSGLTAQPDGTQEVLVALSAGGGGKLATDLSKGTRFQLYLALRIAGYHELAQSRPTVPFIADDIMETFDDDRSTAAFGLLEEMARVGQVIYLTHHRHLRDIALATCPGANIIDL